MECRVTSTRPAGFIRRIILVCFFFLRVSGAHYQWRKFFQWDRFTVRVFVRVILIVQIAHG